MEQLPLDISGPREPSFENFLPGRNAEALARVRELAAGRLHEAIVYLWGEPASGRTHLLRAAARADPALVIADDVQSLGPEEQQQLFADLDAARNGRGAVLAAGDASPAQLALRDDLRSRLAWGLVYQLRPLSDDDKARHLRAEAERRGLRLADDVVRYLLTRLPRDLARLNATLDLLDRYSLSRQRHITLPLVREVLASVDRQAGWR